MNDRKQLADQAAASLVASSRMVGEKTGRVKDLGGYRKPPQPLGSGSQWEQDFVCSAGHAEVSSHATGIYQQIRELFRFKRKDSSFTHEGSLATITTPDFDVNLSLEQNPDNAGQYLLRTAVSSFRRPEVIDEPDFLKIFSPCCDRVEFDLVKSIDLEQKIDEIEEIDALVDAIDYDPECSWFTLKIPGNGIVIRATSGQIVFSLDEGGDLETLLQKTRAALSRLAGEKILLGLPTH